MKLNKAQKEQVAFWKQTAIKSLVMTGFTYFSVAVTLQSFTNIIPAFLSGCLYFFTEMTKYYKLNSGKKVLSPTVKNKYSFLI